MKNTIIADPNKLRSNMEEILVVSNLEEVDEEETNIYIPSSLLAIQEKKVNIYVYFELECSPYFDKVKQLIGQEVKPKGIFRYRRKTKTDTHESLLVEDVAAICSFFGDPKHVFIKRTAQKNPYHVIITLDFGNGIMAHVEYTVTDKDQIELEWSGIDKLLEFDSDEMNPFMSNEADTATFALRLEPTVILDKSYIVDKELSVMLDKYRSLIKGGFKK